MTQPEASPSNNADAGRGLSEGLGLAPERAGQAHMMTITGGMAPDEGHWYSPAAVREMLAAERERWQRELGECTGALQTVEREAAMWEERARHLGWRDEHGA